MSKQALMLVGLLGPFVIWAAIFAAAKYCPLEARSILRVLIVGRWLSWLALIVLMFYSVMIHHLPSSYGWSALMFYFGLGLSESWLRHQLGPDVWNVETPYWNPKKWT